MAASWLAAGLDTLLERTIIVRVVNLLSPWYCAAGVPERLAEGLAVNDVDCRPHATPLPSPGGVAESVRIAANWLVEQSQEAVPVVFLLQEVSPELLALLRTSQQCWLLPMGVASELGGTSIVIATNGHQLDSFEAVTIDMYAMYGDWGGSSTNNLCVVRFHYNEMLVECCSVHWPMRLDARLLLAQHIMDNCHAQTIIGADESSYHIPAHRDGASHIISDEKPPKTGGRGIR